MVMVEFIVSFLCQYLGLVVLGNVEIGEIMVGNVEIVRISLMFEKVLFIGNNFVEMVVRKEVILEYVRIVACS